MGAIYCGLLATRGIITDLGYWSNGYWEKYDLGNGNIGIRPIDKDDRLVAKSTIVECDLTQAYNAGNLQGIEIITDNSRFQFKDPMPFNLEALITVDDVLRFEYSTNVLPNDLNSYQILHIFKGMNKMNIKKCKVVFNSTYKPGYENSTVNNAIYIYGCIREPRLIYKYNNEPEKPGLLKGINLYVR